MGMVEPEFMDARQAAALLGLSHRTLEGYRVSGGGPDFHRFGNRVRYRRGPSHGPQGRHGPCAPHRRDTGPTDSAAPVDRCHAARVSTTSSLPSARSAS